MTVKFLHAADIHLDAPFKEHGTNDYAQQRRKDIRDAFASAISLAISSNVDFILICGDLYEHDYTSRKTIEWLAGQLERFKKPIIMIPGNHDPYVANSWYKNFEWPKHVRLLTDASPSLILEDLKVLIHGIGFSSSRQDKPDLEKISKPLEGYFNILMLHGTLDLTFGKTPYHPVTSAELNVLGYDYYALGHFHKQNNTYELKKAANPGSPEPLGFDEKGEHGVFVTTLTMDDSSKVKIDTEKASVARKHYVEPVLDITPFETLDRLKMELLGILEKLDAARDLVRIHLTGRTALQLDCEALESLLSQGFLMFELRDETQKSLDLGVLARENTLKGLFVRDMLEKLNELEAKGLMDEAKTVRDALYFGIEALETGKVTLHEIN